jgi:REP element-mobilizing transposase RayT
MTPEGQVSVRTRGRLPHWQQEESTYFLTFRLFDSLPQELLRATQQERAIILKSARLAERELTVLERTRLTQLARRIEKYLDQGAGACFLRDDRVARLVADALRFWDGDRYQLLAWCVMPNHVHVVLRPAEDIELGRVLHSWKSFTSKEGNRILGRSGPFWQREYYDHLIRGGKLESFIRYVVDNPEKAGLSDWPWVWRA